MIIRNAALSSVFDKEVISKDRYMKTWRSVNDIRVQAGEERFDLILKKIQTKISEIDELTVPYLNTCWTARRIN